MSDTDTQIKQVSAPVPPDHREPPKESAPDPAALVESDLLVEDVSIDGMCGVY